MAPPPPPPPAAAAAGLMVVNAKRYTLAALLGTLAVAAIVTVSFMVLCPARITFSVARTSSSIQNRSGTAGGGGGGGSLVLNLTLAADNPSRRAKVTFVSMFVDLSNSTAPGGQWHSWVRATVTTSMPLRQAGRSAAIDATVPLVDAPAFTGNMTSSFSVMVTAQARFTVGVARTRLYDIRVSCSPVSFFSAKAKPAAGGSGDDGAARLPVRCV